MKVKDVITTACQMLEKDSLATKIAGGSELTSDETSFVATLVKCFNFVQNEVATEFCPLVCSQKLTSTNGQIDIDNLTQNFVYVKSLKDLNENNLKYKIQGDKIVFNANDVVIEYCYCPDEAVLSDDVEVCLSKRVLSYGVLREYFLLQDLSVEASAYEERFKNSLAIFSNKKSQVTLPKRKWF